VLDGAKHERIKIKPSQAYKLTNSTPPEESSLLMKSENWPRVQKAVKPLTVFISNRLTSSNVSLVAFSTSSRLRIPT
jgi:hypothetical protein